MNGNVTMALKHSFSAAEMRFRGKNLSTETPDSEPYALPVVLARFGMWTEILNLRHALGTAGNNSTLLGGYFTFCLWKYAEGMALAGKGDLEGAQAVLQDLQRSAQSVPPDEIPSQHRFWPAHEVLASTMVLTLQARLSQLRLETQQAIRLLEEAIRQHSPIPYMEPEHWYLPLKQCLGKLLVDEKEYTKAMRVYREDLADHPLNAWSYLGMAQAYSRRDGTGSAKAVRYHLRFQDAWARAEVSIHSSCCEFGC